MNAVEWAGLATLLTMVAACGEDFESKEPDPTCAAPQPTCESAPWCCPETQTCWIDSTGTALVCHNAGGGQDGEPCQNYFGQAGCAPGLGCYQLDTSVPGRCTPYCSQTNADHACPGGRPCQQLISQGSGVSFFLCGPGG